MSNWKRQIAVIGANAARMVVNTQVRLQDVFKSQAHGCAAALVIRPVSKQHGGPVLTVFSEAQMPPSILRYMMPCLQNALHVGQDIIATFSYS